MDLKRLNELLVYSPHTGEVRMKSSNAKITPDADGFYTIYDLLSKKRTKMKANRLSWSLGNNKRLQRSNKILHRNLRQTDNRLSNLVLVSPRVYSKINEARKNLGGALRITPHPNDRYDYIVYYFSDKVLKKEIYCDMIAAKNRLIELQLRFAKVLTRHCNFDN